MQCATIFPVEDLFPQPLPQLPDGLRRFLGPARLSPSFLKLCHLTRTQQISCLEPEQNRAEVRKEFHGFTVLDRTRVQEIQRELVPDKEKSVFPIRVRLDPRLAHS